MSYWATSSQNHGQSSKLPWIATWKDDIEAKIRVRTLLGSNALEIWCGAPLSLFQARHFARSIIRPAISRQRPAWSLRRCYRTPRGDAANAMKLRRIGLKIIDHGYAVVQCWIKFMKALSWERRP